MECTIDGEGMRNAWRYFTCLRKEKAAWHGVLVGFLARVMMGWIGSCGLVVTFACFM
jgi:hypothetical protein